MKLVIQALEKHETLTMEIVKSTKPEDIGKPGNLIAEIECLHLSDWKTQEIDEYTVMAKRQVRMESLMKKGVDTAQFKRAAAEYKSNEMMDLFATAAIIKEEDRIAWNLLGTAQKSALLNDYISWTESDRKAKKK